MKMTPFYYVDFEKHVRNCQTDSEREIELVRVQFGNVFFNRLDAVEYALRPTEKKCHELTDEEREEQYAWALTMMTDEERNAKHEKTFSEMTLCERDRLQLEFARQMEGWSDKEYERKVKAFERRTWYERKMQYAII